jgi:hypothetical protein
MEGNNMQKRAMLLFLFLIALPLLVSCGRLSSEQKTAASDALKALQKVDAATQVGVNKIQYGSLLIDAQAAVNQAVPKLPDGELVNEIKAAMECYADANAGWSEAGTGTLVFLRNNPTAAHLKQKYDIELAVQSNALDGGMNAISKDTMLSVIWKKGSEHLGSASKLLGE